MQLFISKGLWRYRNEQIRLEEIDDNRSKLIIPNLSTDKGYKNIEFILPVKISDLKEMRGDYIISFSKLRKNLNGYTFESKKIPNSKVIYALLHYDRVVPSDIYIHTAMKEYVEVLEKVQFHDIEPDYGTYLTKFYFVKIAIPNNQSVRFYLSWRNGLKRLERHLIFSNEKHYGISVKNARTCTKLDSLRRKEYIALSDL